MGARKKWVVGLLFRNKDEVALIEKTHPAWQAGKLNGIGGKIHEGETPLAAMQREFEEEAGVAIEDWREFLFMKVQDGDLNFFVAHGDYPIKTMTDEKVSWYKVSGLSALPLLNNLHWVIPLALDPNVRRTESEYYQVDSEPRT